MKNVSDIRGVQLSYNNHRFQCTFALCTYIMYVLNIYIHTANARHEKLGMHKTLQTPKTEKENENTC